MIPSEICMFLLVNSSCEKNFFEQNFIYYYKLFISKNKSLSTRILICVNIIYDKNFFEIIKFIVTMTQRRVFNIILTSNKTA